MSTNTGSSAQIDPRAIGVARNRTIPPTYSGCRTQAYSPVDTTAWLSRTSTTADAWVLARNVKNMIRNPTTTAAVGDQNQCRRNGGRPAEVTIEAGHDVCRCDCGECHGLNLLLAAPWLGCWPRPEAALDELGVMLQEVNGRDERAAGEKPPIDPRLPEPSPSMQAGRSARRGPPET